MHLCFQCIFLHDYLEVDPFSSVTRTISFFGHFLLSVSSSDREQRSKEVFIYVIQEVKFVTWETEQKKIYLSRVSWEERRSQETTNNYYSYTRTFETKWFPDVLCYVNNLSVVVIYTGYILSLFLGLREIIVSYDMCITKILVWFVYMMLETSDVWASI